jgi:hypothetical protein
MALLPSKHWALYSTCPVTRKFTGPLEKVVVANHDYDALISYIQRKHRFNHARLDGTDTEILGAHLNSIPMHKQITLIKLMHQLALTNQFLRHQKHSITPLYPRYGIHTQKSRTKIPMQKY